jgi:NADH-quinone oxidoreductase subunit M
VCHNNKAFYCSYGAISLQIAHGLSSSALFIIVGSLYDRYKSRNIFYYKNLVEIMPQLSFYLFIFSLANMGFPLTFNFVSEFLIFMGIYSITPSISILTLIGTLLSGVYMISLMTRMIYGKSTRSLLYYYDITRREHFILFPLLILTISLGIYPIALLDSFSVDLLFWLNV